MNDSTFDKLTSQESESDAADADADADLGVYRRRRSRFDVMLISPMFVNTPSGGWQVGVEKVLQAVVWKAKRSTSLHVHVGRRSWGT